MCENCGINHDTSELENEDAFNAFLDRLFGGIEAPEITNYMDEYRTSPDVTVSGDFWKIDVAKNGGTSDLDKAYEPGEEWIINVYEDDVLTDSMVMDAVSAKTTQQVANEFATHLFGHGLPQIQ